MIIVTLTRNKKAGTVSTGLFVYEVGYEGYFMVRQPLIIELIMD